VTAVFTTKIELDPSGVAWVEGTGTKVIEIVLDKLAYGWSPEETHLQHSHLSLAQIHAALHYYYENQVQLDAQIRHDLEESDVLAKQVSDPALYERLRALMPRGEL